jgi:hypothetical protein
MAEIHRHFSLALAIVHTPSVAEQVISRVITGSGRGLEYLAAVYNIAE